VQAALPALPLLPQLLGFRLRLRYCRSEVLDQLEDEETARLRLTAQEALPDHGPDGSADERSGQEVREPMDGQATAISVANETPVVLSLCNNSL
jgi:hypothetical protein